MFSYIQSTQNRNPTTTSFFNRIKSLQNSSRHIQIFQYLPVHHPPEIGSRLHTETFIRLPVECIPAIPLIPIFRISDIQIKNRFIHPFGSSDQSLTEITATSQDDMLSDKRNLSVIIRKDDAGAKGTTADALPDIIRYCLANGYSIQPITPATKPVHHGIAN